MPPLHYLEWNGGDSRPVQDEQLRGGCDDVCWILLAHDEAARVLWGRVSLTHIAELEEQRSSAFEADASSAVLITTLSVSPGTG